MTLLKRILSNIIHGNNNFCCLCFQEVNEIFEIKSGCIGVDIDMLDIFSYIFDSEASYIREVRYLPN